MTIKEFAALAGVSVSTVSKIMNGKDASISAKTREHVLELAKEYHYAPYVSPLTRTLTIGVVLRDETAVRLLIPSLLKTATSYGYSILLRESKNSLETEQKNLSAMIAAHADGVLLDPVQEGNPEVCLPLAKAGIPFLMLGDGEHSLGLNFTRMGYLAAETLVNRHHARIACIADSGPQSTRFYQGYRECLFERHLAFEQELVFSDADSLPVGGITGHDFTGVVISSYEEALRLYRRLETLHYSIPDDLSIVTLREDTVPGDGYPPLSSIAIPYGEFGAWAAESLIAMIEKREAENRPPMKFAVESFCSVDIPGCLKKKRILSIGSVNVDNYLNFETLPRTGRTSSSLASSTYPGGKCINQAVGAAKLGHSVSVIGRVGNDADSDLIYRAIKDLQIDATGLKRSSGCRTGQAYIFVQKNGDSMISLLAGANSLVDAADIKSCERLFLGASHCLLQTEIPMEAVLSAAAMAKSHGLTTVVKPSSCAVLPDALAASTDILIPNAEELSVLCPQESSMAEKASSLLEKGIGTVIVTMGAEGCCIFEGSQETRIPAADFLPVDNTGAGDAFISAFVSYLLYGCDTVTAARIATYAAGFSITRQGVSNALVDKTTLETYLKKKEPALLRE